MRAELLGLPDPGYITDTGHRVWSEMSIEIEMAELLCALVRYAKPELVVESGTGQGLSTQAISQGLLANGQGVIHSWEPIEEFFTAATEAFKEHDNVVIHRGRASEDCELVPDFVFVDTGGGGEFREPEIAYWLKHEARPLVVVHDANRKYESLGLGEGLHIPGWDGVWVGRAR